MAKIITIAQTKGGVSKSTLALFIYQYLKEIGANVVIYDGDEQKTITQLNKRFNKGLRILEPKDDFGHDVVKELHTIGFDFIIADTPPYRSKKHLDLFGQSSFVLVPFKPSLLDAMAGETMLSELRAIPGISYAAILTQVRPGVSFTAQIRGYLETMGFPVLKTEMHVRVAYSRGVMLPNLSDEGDEKAVKEIADITAEILAHIAKTGNNG